MDPPPRAGPHPASTTTHKPHSNLLALLLLLAPAFFPRSAYCTVNKQFAERVIEVYEPGYLTWVHDYHLILLPSYILRRHRTAHIGLFLHSPFPASDVFRTIGA